MTDGKATGGAAAPALVAEGLQRAYGRREVLRGVDLSLADGEVVALTGPNGSGKTTLLLLLSGLMRPDAGTVRIAGRDPRRDVEARRGLGLLLHEEGLYDDLTAFENLRLHAALRGLDDPTGAARAALEAAGLGARADDLVRGFSRGMRRRVALARASLHAPRLLLLDEPRAGLDAEADARLGATLRAAAAAGAAILYATHGGAIEGTTRTLHLEDGRLR